VGEVKRGERIKKCLESVCNLGFIYSNSKEEVKL